METMDYTRMDLGALRQAYSQEMERFKESLLNGTPWEEIQDCRLNVTALSVELHNRLQVANRHPAQSGLRAH